MALTTQPFDGTGVRAYLIASLVTVVINAFMAMPCVSQASQVRRLSSASKVDTARLAIDFEAVDLRNQQFLGKSLEGKIVLLDFWAVWCKPCIAAFPTLQKLHRDFKDKNFEVVGVAVYSGGPKDVSQFVKKYDLNYKIVVGDADLALRFGVIGFPSYFLIGSNGKIHKRYVGEAKDLYSEVKKGILKLHTDPSQ